MTTKLSDGKGTATTMLNVTFEYSINLSILLRLNSCRPLTRRMYKEEKENNYTHTLLLDEMDCSPHQLRQISTFFYKLNIQLFVFTIFLCLSEYVCPPIMWFVCCNASAYSLFLYSPKILCVIHGK